MLWSNDANITADYPRRRCRFFRYRRMMFGMPPSDHHRFYLTDTETVVELHWRGAAPAPSRGVLARLAAFLSGPRPGPWHMVDHKAFDRAVEALATDAATACETFARLGYDVTVHAPDLRAAA